MGLVEDLFGGLKIGGDFNQLFNNYISNMIVAKAEIATQK